MLLKDLYKYTVNYGVFHLTSEWHGEWSKEKITGYVAADSEEEAYQALRKKWSEELTVYSIRISKSIGLVDIVTE